MKHLMTKILFLLVAGGFIVGLEDGLSQAETNKKILNLKMYVPSPIAIYQRLTTSILQLTPLDSADAGVCLNVPELEGSLYFDKGEKQIYICDSAQGWIVGTDIWEKKEKIRNQTVNSIYPLDIAEDTSEYKIGIGTTTPEFQLSLEGDGSFIAVGHPTKRPSNPEIPILTSGRDLSTEGEGSKLIWWPKMGAFRAGYVEDDEWDSGNIGRYSVAMGLDTIAKGTASITAGGFKNEVYTTEQVTISGGYGNQVLVGDWSTISGGSGNFGRGLNENTISGGENNSTGYYQNGNFWYKINHATVSGGSSNSVAAVNKNDADFGIISGGKGNNSVGDKSFGVISGGYNNKLDNQLGDGYANTIAGGGGNGIQAEGYCTIGGGDNTIGENSWSSTILGGEDNNFAGDNSTVLGGFSNRMPVVAAGVTVGGGQNNAAYGGDYAVILGGGWNSTQQGPSYKNSSHVTIHGGYQNREDNGSKSTTILGGNGNETSEDYAVAAGYQAKTVDGFVWSVDDFSVPSVSGFIIDAPKVGIGITDPTATLHVNGNIKADLRRLSRGIPIWASKYNQSTKEIGYDVAELFETTEKVEKGDVLVLDEKEKFKLKRATGAYDKKVIGIVSSSPAILFKGSQLEIAPSPGGFLKGTKPPVALSGRVLCKVTNENGPIEAGDFLTTSSHPGYAMKATDKEKFFGTVLGKALEPLGRGKTGLILVLVTLQ